MANSKPTFIYVLLFLASSLEVQSVHPDGTFVYCECPDVVMDPNLVLDERTACDQANTYAAEVAITQVGDQLVATSLNMDLGQVFASLTPEQEKMPITILSDIVRIRQTIRMVNPTVTIRARKMLVAKSWSKVNQLIPEGGSSIQLFVSQVEGDLLVKSQLVSPSSEMPPCDDNLKAMDAALERFNDQYEYVLALSKTFNNKGGECREHTPSADARDFFRDSYVWAQEVMAKCSFPDHLTRLNLLHRYRGPMLEGDYVSLLKGSNAKEVADTAQLMHGKTVDEASHLENDMKVTWQSLKKAISDLPWDKDANAIADRNQAIAVAITESLFEGDFVMPADTTEEKSCRQWVDKMYVIDKSQKAMSILMELRSMTTISGDIIEFPHEHWPKEFDFQEFRQNVETMFTALPAGEEKLEIKRTWTRLLFDFESLYHLRNMEATLILHTTLHHLSQRSGEQFGTGHFRAAVEQDKMAKRIVEKPRDTQLTSSIELKGVPAHLLAAGLVEKQIWPSAQLFNDYAHLRVNGITVQVDGVEANENDYLILSNNVLFHDLNQDGDRLAYSGFPVSFPHKMQPTTPFNRWRLMAASQSAKAYLKAKHTVDVKLSFHMQGLYTPGLTGLVRDEKCPADDPDAFTECKYNERIPFYAMCDIVTAMSLPEINHLLRQKYENQIDNGIDEGVTTWVDTDWSGNIGNLACTEIPNVGSYNITTYVKMSAHLGPPRIQFPQNLEGFIELTYLLLDAHLYERSFTYECRPNGNLLGNKTDTFDIFGSITVVVPLAMTTGCIDGDDGDGIVYLYFEESALNSKNITYNNPLGKDQLFEATKRVFIKTFTQTELARLKYDPGVTPKFVRPKKFVFMTVCEGCTGSLADEGYLITMIQTQSINSLWIGHQVDPHTLGLEDACPNAYNAVVYLASHITMCDIYFDAFQKADTDLSFAVQVDHTTDGHPFLVIQYLTDFCVAFTVPELAENDVTIHIYTASFQFKPFTKKVETTLDNSNGEHEVGDLIRKILSGDIKSDCSKNCEHWWDWFNPFTGCLSIYNLVCWIKAIFNKLIWEEGSFHAYKTTETSHIFQPECLQFKFPQMNFEPEIEFIFNGEPTSKDDEAISDATKRVGMAMQNALSFKLTESPSISLFAAVNLLFPGSKVVESDERAFYSPGPIILYGNVVKDYIPCEDIHLPEECGHTIQC